MNKQKLLTSLKEIQQTSEDRELDLNRVFLVLNILLDYINDVDIINAVDEITM